MLHHVPTPASSITQAGLHHSSAHKGSTRRRPRQAGNGCPARETRVCAEVCKVSYQKSIILQLEGSLYGCMVTQCC
jgi:hypothetical protein